METKTTLTIKEYLDEKMSSDKVFRLTKSNVVPSLVKVDQNERPIPGRGVMHPNSFTLPSEYIFYDNELKKSRHCRLVIGQPSIFKDERPLEKDVMLKVQLVSFGDKGQIHVKREEDNLMKFMLLAPWNASNPFRKKDSAADFFE